ncbi:MAG TPA: CocE/NonD family hydrolase [Candidatus Thermoplasmatota archaeon]|nr:CocE/NonD family hydrolase [Candidatus Thermoplasmatota archaeon]
MRAAAALLVAASLVAGCASLVPGAEVDAEGFAPRLFEGALFHEEDLILAHGERLHADVYLPDGPLAPGAPSRFPAILVLSPYWGAGTSGAPLGFLPYDFLVTRLVPRGYAVVYGDLPGAGGSSGCWDDMGPVEREGAAAMVEAVAAQPWSDGKVGMVGMSYDAISQVLAASAAPPHLVTIVPAAPLTHAYGGVLQDGVRYGVGWRDVQLEYESGSLAPPGTNQERYPGWTERVVASPPCVAENHLGDPPTGAYTEYFAARDLRAHGTNVRASVFYMQGFLDANVKPDNFGAWFDAVPTLKKAWLGAWPHAYPTARGAGRDDMYLTIHRWLDHELKGIPNGIDSEPAIDVQDQLGRWRHESAWPPPDATPRAFALGAASFGLASDAAIPLDAPEGLHVSGAPELRLRVASDRPLGRVIARLYDGDALVSQGAFDLLFAGGLDEPRPLSPGKPVDVTLHLYPTDHEVAVGSPLRLVLATKDAGDWYEDDASGATLTLASGTLTLPTVHRGDEDVFLVSCGAPAKPPVPACFRALSDRGTGP